MSTFEPAPATDDVAIIGLALRFPGAETLEELGGHLVAGRSLISEVPPERWSKDRYFGDPRRGAQKTNSIWGGFVEHADCFDAEFFNISPREAETMDPQQRMALELAWRAIENMRLCGERSRRYGNGCLHGRLPCGLRGNDGT